MLLSEKTAIVTGGALGIGAGIAELFARQGATVYILDIDAGKGSETAAAIRSSGGMAHSLACDVSRRSQVDAALGRTLEAAGHVDILVNNAGIYPRRLFLDMTEPEWDRMFEVNLKSLFYLCKAVVPSMVARRSGKIINISSVTFFKGMEKLSHYVATKGGMIGFSRSLAREMGPHNVYVNSITPGAIQTEGEVVHADPAALAAIQTAQCLDRRLVPIDVARVCLFLASELSDGMTGQNLNVDGGLILY